MFSWLRNLWKWSSKAKDHYDPVWGLSERALVDWLRVNPDLREKYESLRAQRTPYSSRQDGFPRVRAREQDGTYSMTPLRVDGDAPQRVRRPCRQTTSVGA